ncbi:gliding motility-associated peptidyl-prolyl isomerase GldI [Flavobacteriaceae bacterium 3-367]|uniref:gliding motility-associated peptidyl-prolyl isomerase GldI n=1 Tax=Eudoraea algarum TaxID=3417568 RepID=UPI003277796F
MIRPLVFLLLALGLMSCGGPEARRPVKVKTGSFIKESVERNRQLLAAEEKMIQDIIAQDSAHTYLSSANSSWYYYETKNGDTDYVPETDDLVVLTYNVVSFTNDTLYRAEDIGPVRYKVDKQELFPGLRNSVKLLKEGETATFLFPSSMAFGYHGDNDQIGPNVPIKSTISLLQIIKQKDSIQN